MNDWRKNKFFCVFFCCLYNNYILLFNLLLLNTKEVYLLYMIFNKKQIFDLELYLSVRKIWVISESEKKYIKKIQEYCSIFQHIPGLLMIGIGNSLAMNSGNKNSDIDLFIVTQKNTLWFVRVIMTFIVAITWNRKTQKTHAGKICLSFFVTEESLNFSDIAFKNDIYLYYRILTMKPVLIRWDIYQKFIDENTWINFDMFQYIHKHNSEYLQYKLVEKKEGNIAVKYIDNILRKILISRSMKKYEKLWKPEWVIINNTMLKFHDKDRRREIAENVLEKI